MNAVRATESRHPAGLGPRGGSPDPRAASPKHSPVLDVDESGAGAFLGGAG